ncbi:unnamed protein product [Ceutorhynchus assimilis]|uniref:Uncharacterized protein n=1 Tax=Ceutorhynchus assimilis TaxID=467358 RepID=A0A9N9MPD8_9CUCU|nr:unnamed protein product [Ceutorhynchus assimilis]
MMQMKMTCTEELQVEVEAGPHINDEINYDDNSEIMNVSDVSNAQDSRRPRCSGVCESQNAGCAKEAAEEIPEELSATLPSDIIPLPIFTKKRKRTRKGLKSTLLTSTPYKEELEKIEEEKQKKKERKVSEKIKNDKKYFWDKERESKSILL